MGKSSVSITKSTNWENNFPSEEGQEGEARAGREEEREARREEEVEGGEYNDEERHLGTRWKAYKRRERKNRRVGIWAKISKMKLKNISQY